MARSAKRIIRAGVATLPLAVVLSGCVTTQRIAARARLVDARLRASQSPAPIPHANPQVEVLRVTAVRNKAPGGVAVWLRNLSSRALTDLPIVVGVRSPPGRVVYLNRAANLDYFSTHVAVIGPHASAVWVYTSPDGIPGGRLSAIVGSPDPAQPAQAPLPQIDVHLLPRVGNGSSLELSVSNASAIPQYDLQVYAVGERAGRTLALGKAAIAHLGTHGRTRLDLNLIGSAPSATLRLSASPTIFN